MSRLWWHGIRSNAHRLNECTHGWLGIMGDAARETPKPVSAITAAAIAYFAFFSLFPLVLLSISIASFSLVSTYISVSNLVFGSVAAIIAILAWAYLSGLIFLVDVFLSISYYQLIQQYQEAAGQIHS